MTNKEINTGKDLADAFRSDAMINKEAIDENIDLIKDIFKGTIYEIKDGE
jgi:hypothetical protein|tara:strand:- start:569 stop:718 length:150 start_codon:yes stop_codon:yes gene_type:complete